MGRFPGRPLEVRERIVLLTVSLTALALVLAGLALWVSQDRRVDDQIDATLQRTSAEFGQFASGAVDPATGQAFASTEALLFAAMGNEVAAENEGILAFLATDSTASGTLEGTLRYRQALQTLRLADDAAFFSHVAPATVGERAFIATTATARTEYRYAVIPVQVGRSAPGALVVAFDRTAEGGAVSDLMRTYLLISAFALALLSAAGWVLSGRLLRPVKELRDLSTTINEQDLTKRLPVRGNDDLADLARSFNGMVDRLEEAFSSQRQLLDDAGHELRTPITVVRGHLELMDPEDPEDARATRALALDELDRMRRLTDDLVLLAKSQAPHFLSARPVDTYDLTRTVFDHARRLGNREWLLAEAAHGVVLADGQRLTQAWLQLTANAVQFSAAGSRIELGSRFTGEELWLWVADQGTGVAPEDVQRIFARFTQVGAARDGGGLGLPIVSAIAQAHGGRVEVNSALGVGSRFTIVLPNQQQGLEPADAP